MTHLELTASGNQSVMTCYGAEPSCNYVIGQCNRRWHAGMLLTRLVEFAVGSEVVAAVSGDACDPHSMHAVLSTTYHILLSGQAGF